MTDTGNILEEKRDLDTLGGRIGRAREASGLTMEDMAAQLGVTQDTWDNWEGDREEPRANRLAMLAGFLNVSPSWLLYGVGESPTLDTTSAAIQLLVERVEKIEAAHAETGEAILMLRDAIKRLASSENEGV